MANRQYSADQRAQATRRVIDGGQSAAMVAREMSVSVTTVQRWVAEALMHRAPVKTTATEVTTGPTLVLPGASSRKTLERQLDDLHRRLDELELQVSRLLVTSTARSLEGHRPSG